MQWHIDGLLDGFFGYFGWDNTRGLLTCAYTFLWRKYPTYNARGFATNDEHE